MLSSLQIENVAVIQKANVHFEKGLNVLTGETGAGKSILIDSINAILGNRTSKDLVRTGAAQALIFPSLFEGFGIPVLEAILCEVPVAASNSTSMPEVAGNAAIYFEPTSDESIAEAMERIWMDTQLRQRLISNARVQRQKFSWEQAASRLYDIIAKTIES